MKRYILTGAPGAGKTCILRQFEVLGLPVVEEAASDVIALRSAEGVAEPHTGGDFIASIATLQRKRRLRAAQMPESLQAHDRSAICTLALARWLGQPVPPELARELADIAAEGAYERQVVFVEMMGFIAPTEARTISYADSVDFGRLHEAVYAELGYELVRIPAAPLHERVNAIRALIDPSA
jgi:predicted ATPase